MRKRINKCPSTKKKNILLDISEWQNGMSYTLTLEPWLNIWDVIKNKLLQFKINTEDLPH